LAQPKAMRRGFGAKREPVKVFDESPITKQKVNILEGRYGLYATDGETNASLPKGTSVESLTFAEVLELLAARAAMGPPAKKKAGRKRPAATKKAATTKAATPKAAKKPKATAKKATIGAENGKSAKAPKTPRKSKSA
jgi:DNA topoisomerase-1